MDVNRAFSAPFQDQKWLTKGLIGGLLSWTGLGAPAVTGFTLDYVRQVANGQDVPLPEWSDLGRQWVRGFLFGIAAFVYLLPAIILWSLAFVPLIVAAVNASLTGDASAALDPAATAGLATACLLGLLGTAWAVAVSVFIGAAAVNYALRDSFGSMFAFGEMMQRIRSTQGYFQAWGLSLVIFFATGALAALVGGIVGSVLQPLAFLTGIVSGFAGFVAYMMSAHLFGQWAAGAYGIAGGAGTIGEEYAAPMPPEPPSKEAPAPVVPGPPAPPTDVPPPPAPPMDVPPPPAPAGEMPPPPAPAGEMPPPPAPPAEDLTAPEPPSSPGGPAPDAPTEEPPSYAYPEELTSEPVFPEEPPPPAPPSAPHEQE